MPILTDDFGRYAEGVKLFKTFITKHNVEAKRPKNGGTPCYCALNIAEDVKKLTKEDYTVLATSRYGVDNFDLLIPMMRGATKTDANTGELTKDAQQAVNALTDLTPEGMDTEAFYNMLVQITKDKKAEIATARKENKKWLTNLLQENVANLRVNGQPVTKFDEATLMGLTKQAKTVGLFDSFTTVADFAAETVTDPNTKTQYFTETAEYAQKALATLSKDGDWKTLYAAIIKVDKATVEARTKLVEQEDTKKQPEVKPESTGQKSGTHIQSLNVGDHAWVNTLPIPANEPSASTQLIALNGIRLDDVTTINANALSNYTVKKSATPVLVA